MAQVKEWICDRCGARVERLEAHRIIMDPRVGMIVRHFDVCHECRNAVVDFIRTQPGKEGAK